MLDRDGLQELLQRGRVLAEQDGPLLTVTLDRPEQLNAQTPSTWRALAAVAAAMPPDVRVVVIRGAGASFSAGLDRSMFTAQGVPGELSLRQLAALAPDELDAAIADFQSGFACWGEVGAVTIAAVQGHAIGAGFQLALACDLRVVSADVRFAMRETSLGLVPDLGGTSPLVAAVGYPRALEICATGRWVDAQEALAIGLANSVAPDGQLDASLDAVVGSLLAAPPGALLETLALLRGAAGRTPEQQRAAERAAQGRRLRELAGMPAVVGGVGHTD